MYKHILIDLDDTLWDFRGNSKMAMNEIFDEYNLIRLYESFESFYVVYVTKNHQLWEQYAKGEVTKEFLSLERFLYPLRQAGCDDVILAKKLGEDFLYRTTLKTNLVDGAIELLDYLRARGYTLSIISNGFVEVQHTKLNRSGLSSHFSHVFLSEEVGYQKPDIRFFQTVLSELNAEPTACIVIGDNLQTDILGAQNAGIDAIFYDRVGDSIVESDLKVAHIDHLLAIKSIL